MTTITIVLTEQPALGATVFTNASAPRVGEKCSPAQALAIDLLRTCQAQGNAVQYDIPSQTGLTHQLLKDLLHPEELGHAVTAEVRDRARICLGIPPVESHLCAEWKPC